MANTRGSGQKLIPVPASERFIRELNEGFRKAGYSNRSQFIRDAMVEKLSRMGIEIPRELSVPPDRIGKGGRPGFPVKGASGKKTASKGVSGSPKTKTAKKTAKRR
jgi:hypothetical protein